jgi:ribose transport system permease protein
MMVDTEKNSGTVALRFVKRQPILILLVCYIIVIGIVKPTFVSVGNLKNVLIDASIYGVAALAMTIAIICGEFDLSLASNFMWSQIFFCFLLNEWGGTGFGIFAAWIVMVLSCIAIGALNGLIVVKGKINSFITTLGMMTIVKGVCLVFTDGEMISTNNEFIKMVGKGTLFGFSYLTYIFILLIVISFFVMKYTRFGRGLFATGGNYAAAELAGINVKFNKFIVFVILGLSAGISGSMFISRMRAGSVLYGTDLSLTCVAATVVGGTPLSGGKGSVLRTVVGVLVIYVLYKSLSFLGLQGYYNSLIKGLVLLIVVTVDAYMTRSGKVRRK